MTEKEERYISLLEDLYNVSKYKIQTESVKKSRKKLKKYIKELKEKTS